MAQASLFQYIVPTAGPDAHPLSRPVPAPVIDADKAQREAIDADLVRSF